MKIIGITACATGIAHTFIAKEKLENAAVELGHDIKIETQGWGGPENKLTQEDVANADVVIIAADIAVDKSRFAGKPLVEVPISMVMKSSKNFIKKIEEKMQK